MSLDLTRSGIADLGPWRRAGFDVPAFDLDVMKAATLSAPRWVHFGGGNIFRAFLAPCQQELLNTGRADTGIIAVSANDAELVDRIYRPHDNLILNVAASADGTLSMQVVASVAQTLVASAARAEEWTRLEAVFEQPSLQLVSFTITEKGYALTDSRGELLPLVSADIEKGPSAPVHILGKLATLMHRRFLAGSAPVALVSLDNCSHNGEKLHDGLLTVVRAWVERGLAVQEFVAYLSDPRRVSFPWSMIDKITPRPSQEIRVRLEAAGVAGMDIVETEKHTWLAPFVNAEATQYLFIEDDFPNGRPRLDETRGVWFADRATVNKVETMKVTTCLNPIHTAIALAGRLLGYELVSEAMKDRDIVSLVHQVGYVEGLPVAVDPGIIKPVDFLNTVVKERVTNPYLPDTTARIASDTSQKVGIRFGETIKAYRRDPAKDVRNLIGIPLVLACWFRYLAGVNDAGLPFEISPDPMRQELVSFLGPVELGGTPPSLAPLLGRDVLFGTDLNEAGLGGKIQQFYAQMLAGPGAVKATLSSVLASARAARE